MFGWFRNMFATEAPADQPMVQVDVIDTTVAAVGRHYIRHQGQHAKDFCPVCTQFVSVTTKGFWKHQCVAPKIVQD